MINITELNDERRFVRYTQLRNAPRDTLINGVHPNVHKCLAEYQSLLAALTSDLSDMATYHASATASVAPFVAALQAAMRVINDTMHVVNVLAAATGQEAPFAIEAERVTAAGYAALLQSAISTLTATAQAAQTVAGYFPAEQEFRP